MLMIDCKNGKYVPLDLSGSNNYYDQKGTRCREWGINGAIRFYSEEHKNMYTEKEITQAIHTFMKRSYVQDNEFNERHGRQLKSFKDYTDGIYGDSEVFSNDRGATWRTYVHRFKMAFIKALTIEELAYIGVMINISTGSAGNRVDIEYKGTEEFVQKLELCGETYVHYTVYPREIRKVKRDMLFAGNGNNTRRHNDDYYMLISDLFSEISLKEKRNNYVSNYHDRAYKFIDIEGAEKHRKTLHSQDNYLICHLEDYICLAINKSLYGMWKNRKSNEAVEEELTEKYKTERLCTKAIDAINSQINNRLELWYPTIRINESGKVEITETSMNLSEDVEKIVKDMRKLIDEAHNKHGFDYSRIMVCMNERLYYYIEIANQSMYLGYVIDNTKKYRYERIFDCKLKVVETDYEKYYCEVKVTNE